MDESLSPIGFGGMKSNDSVVEMYNCHTRFFYVGIPHFSVLQCFVCLCMVDIVVALVGSMRRSMLGKGNLSFGRALFNLKEFTPINLHIFSIAPPVALFSVLTAD